MVAGLPSVYSGQLRIQVQCSDVDTSGNYTDPTSGLPQFPTNFSSGGILWINSGGLTGAISDASSSGTPNSGHGVSGGFVAFAGFQRVGTFVRANALAGDFYEGSLSVGFVSQSRTTGSGGGYTYSPGSGNVNV